VIHLNDMHTLGFGELDGTRSQRIEAVSESLTGAKFEAQLSLNVSRAHGIGAPVLEICLAHMRAYEARRLREG
jgi:ketopantoate reductase